jgi:dihydrolipoamide dehydrogenase
LTLRTDLDAFKALAIGKAIHPHPTLGESIGMAAEVAHGSCTDLPPVRK